MRTILSSYKELNEHYVIVTLPDSAENHSLVRIYRLNSRRAAQAFISGAYSVQHKFHVYHADGLEYVPNAFAKTVIDKIVERSTEIVTINDIDYLD